MCGRYGRWSRRQRIEELLGIEPSGGADFADFYNITPGVETWIARAKDGKPGLYACLWGLVPYWSKDPTKGARPVNARAETAHEKPMFRKLIRERRCLIPANCYYEWKEMKVGKRPYCIRMKDESPFFIGGMWDVWHAKEQDRLYTFTVLTTFPNEVSGQVHDRMPVIVQPQDCRRWLEPANHDVADILATPPSEGWVAYPVSRRVNSPKNDDAGLIEPEPAQVT
jgi:putative SOS response-associated peptidase YedK